jgi:NAD(P)-dependent dehydrogenase (short-subunit alcohol dehydrogenase family)
VLAARDTAKAEAAAEQVRAKAAPGAKVSVLKLDLASLASVKAAAEEFKAGGQPLHVLMLNAGVMACPFQRTADGHEMQFGTNQLRQLVGRWSAYCLFAYCVCATRVLGATPSYKNPHTHKTVLTPSHHHHHPGSLGHFALVRHLQDALVDTARASGAPGRVVVLASSAHFGPYPDPKPVRDEAAIDSPEGYSAWAAYGQSKLCNVLFAR